MSTTITDVDGLQAMEDDLTEDYVLGNNIDASATSTWNSGAGFAPVGSGINTYSYPRPESDDFGYAGQSGSWTIYPSDGVYYDKVDEETSDDDTTYIQATANGDYVLLAHDATALNIPDDATDISVRIFARVRNVGAGTSYIQGMVNINGTEYLIGSNTAVSSQSYALKSWNMADYPPMGAGQGWTIDQVFSLAVAGVGVKVSDASPNIRITQLYIQVEHDLIFTGTFDGKEYTISDLYINRPTEDNVGLFGYTDGATIQDVTLADFDITGEDYTAALVGEVDDTAISGVAVTGADITGDDSIGGCIGYAYDSTITSSSTTGDVKAGTTSYYVGGFVGVLYENTITSCYSTVTVNGGTTAYAVGGFVGWERENTLTSCYATGNVTGDWELGGFVGGVYSASTYTKCHATGNVTSTGTSGDYIGGFGGGYPSIADTTFSKCYATGDVSTSNGTWAVGGFVGEMDETWTATDCYAMGDVTAASATAVGGFIGYCDDGTVTNCYSIGAVSGNADVGGFCGDQDDSTITACYWDTDTSGTETSDGGTGYATATMLLFATFSAWNISNASAQRNDGYPFLSWEIDESATVWQIFGEGIYPSSWSFPDLLDNKGRPPKNARIRAYRTDVHSEPYLIEEQYTDHNGTASFTKLPIGQNIVFHAVWGGKTGTGNEEWFFLRVNELEDGGTGAGTVAGALDNLGVHAAAIMWELILGD